MEDSPAFTRACALLEELTSMTRLEARGTFRLALKEAGLEAHTVGAKPLAVVTARVLPTLLRRRGVTDVDTVCDNLKARLQAEGSMRPPAPQYDSPEDILARFGRSR